jgi:hypothetical protein
VSGDDALKTAEKTALQSSCEEMGAELNEALLDEKLWVKALG